RLVARGRDAAGNLTASAPISIVVDGPPPQPDGGAGGSPPQRPGASHSGDNYRSGCQAAGEAPPSGSTGLALLVAASLVGACARPVSRRPQKRRGRRRSANGGAR